MCYTILEMAPRKTSLENFVDKNMPQAFRSRPIPTCTAKKNQVQQSSQFESSMVKGEMRISPIINEIF